MKNTTKIKIAKKYEGMLELVEKDGDGYWAYAKEGFEFAGMGCHTAHEYSQKELLEMIRTLRPCECGQCTKQEEEPKEEKIDGLVYALPKAGLTLFSSNRVEIIGERKMKLEDGRIIDQYLYHIEGHTPDNGKPFVSMKDNIILL